MVEMGSHVISVTNAQIDPFSRYEMYVGEGEKNVKV
jgi:hypothetical protein